jgi:hypothetical protein
MSSTVEAPCRNEKFEWLWSSAYVPGMVARPGFSATEGAPQHRTNVLSWTAQHDAVASRLTAVEINRRRLAAELTRTAAMLLIAVLLILVLLPAVLAASGR